MKTIIRTKGGIAYFAKLEAAEIIARNNRIEFPAIRVVSYTLGYAVQVRPNGDYLGPDGRPSMETMIRNFDRALD